MEKRSDLLLSTLRGYCAGDRWRIALGGGVSRPAPGAHHRVGVHGGGDNTGCGREGRHHRSHRPERQEDASASPVMMIGYGGWCRGCSNRLFRRAGQGACAEGLRECARTAKAKQWPLFGFVGLFGNAYQ